MEIWGAAAVRHMTDDAVQPSLVNSVASSSLGTSASHGECADCFGRTGGVGDSGLGPSPGAAIERNGF